MKNTFDVIAKFVNKVAKIGAGATSGILGYQIKTPKCLQEPEKK